VLNHKVESPKIFAEMEIAQIKTPRISASKILSTLIGSLHYRHF
jgi:hypothetical protein